MLTENQINYDISIFNSFPAGKAKSVAVGPHIGQACAAIVSAIGGYTLARLGNQAIASVEIVVGLAHLGF